jgi:hypothetical protein
MQMAPTTLTRLRPESTPVNVSRFLSEALGIHRVFEALLIPSEFLTFTCALLTVRDIFAS